MRYACKTPVERHEIWDVLFVYLAILGDMIWKAIDMARALLRYQFVEDPLACHCCFWVCTGIFRRRTIFLDVHVVLPESMMIPRYFVQNTQWSSRVWEFGFYANIQTCQMDIAFFKHIRFIWHFFPHEHMLVQTPSIVPPTPGVNGRAESIQATRLYLSPVLGREEFDQNRWRVCLEDPRNLQNHRGIGIDMSQAVTPSTYSSCSEASGCERSQVHMNTYEIYETLEPCFANDSYSMQEPLFVCVCVILGSFLWICFLTSRFLWWIRASIFHWKLYKDSWSFCNAWDRKRQMGQMLPLKHGFHGIYTTHLLEKSFNRMHYLESTAQLFYTNPIFFGDRKSIWLLVLLNGLWNNQW